MKDNHTEKNAGATLKVRLLACTPEPEKLVAAAAKFCYSKSGVDEIWDGLDEAGVTSYVEMISELGHASVTEHASFTFGIEGVSRSLLAELTRHRIASYSVKSQRYVREAMFEYVVPPQIAQNEEAAREFTAAMEEDQRHYDRIRALLQEQHKARLMAEGLEEKEAISKAGKLANEDARFVLPNACTTKILLTMNCRSLFHFFELRCCNRAQWEIRALALEMLRQVLQKAPHVFAGAGPGCVRGACPEGKMSCGKAREVRAFYAKLHEDAQNGALAKGDS